MTVSLSIKLAARSGRAGVLVDPTAYCGYDSAMPSPTLTICAEISQSEAISRTLAYYEANAKTYAAQTVGAAVRPRIEFVRP